MNLKDVLATAVMPALAMLPDSMNSAKARVMMLAIGLQESRFELRRQVGGPARGFWQFERDGGVVGVLEHRASKDHAAALCAARGVKADKDAVYPALENDDVLAAGFARLLLWTDPRALPVVGDSGAAWDCYLRNWRPGKPHPNTWGKLYDQAAFAVMRQQEAA